MPYGPARLFKAGKIVISRASFNQCSMAKCYAMAMGRGLSNPIDKSTTNVDTTQTKGAKK